MDFPAVQLLCLEQKDHSLEDHTRDFLDLACLTHFLDRSLCFFFTSPAWASSVRHACQRTVPKRKISPLSWSGCWRTIDLHSLSAPQRRIYPAPLPNHRPVQPSSRCTELLPEPTADGEPAWAHWTGPPLSSERYGYGIHGPSYGPCMCGRSTWVFRPPRASPKHDGRS